MPDYKDAGVDIDVGEAFVEAISASIKKTRRAEVVEDIGGFAGLFALGKYKNPILVSSTDGVGTKIKLANELKKWHGVGIDCVAMCVNDIGCFGAEPLFFLDYLAAARLNLAVLKEVVGGMADACKETGCAILGGETAEMPGVYPPDEWDCAGFTVGVVEKDAIVDGKKIRPGDVVIGVASTGFHSNGFSLVRKIIETAKIDLQATCAETGKSMGETLLTPTKLYTPLILQLCKSFDIRGIAHITGGGLIENPPRVLPAGTRMELKAGSWAIPKFMQLFKEKGGLKNEEFYRVFNAGIGLVLVVSPKEEAAVLKKIEERGDKAWVIGKVTSGENGCQINS